MVMQHNNTELTRVRSSQSGNQLSVHFDYSSEDDQLLVAISQSEHCEQELSYHCRRSRLLNTPGGLDFPWFFSEIKIICGSVYETLQHNQADTQWTSRVWRAEREQVSRHGAGEEGEVIWTNQNICNTTSNSGTVTAQSPYFVSPSHLIRVIRCCIIQYKTKLRRKTFPAAPQTVRAPLEETLLRSV